MACLLVGAPECTIQELTSMFDEPSIAATVITEWTSLARRLGTPLYIIDKYRQDLLLRTLTQSDVIEKLLVEWTSRMSKEATLGTLYQKIPDSLKLLKDMLQDKIREQANCLNDLDADSQNVIMQTNVKFLGRVYSLSSIRDMITADRFEEILNKVEMKIYFRKSFKNEDWDLGYYEIPKPLPYYIQRTLTLKRKLNPTIFKHKCSDIFVFEGMQHHHLSILARPELTDISSEQINKVTRRFILLEHPDDYNEITRIAKDSVHRIKHEDNQFFWLSTSGSCQIIRTFLTNDLEEINETTLVKDHLVYFSNRPIAICSSPGMGKSVLLANLAHEVIKIYPQRVSIYLQLASLISKLSTTQPNIDLENINQLLASSPSISLTGREILLNLLQKKDLIVEIFLDGFDEVPLEFKEQVKEFLKCLLKSTNMRVYITSRPHMRYEIESTLEAVSLDISPFNQENQVNFLCSFWELDHNIKSEKVSRFASTVLKSLEFINQGTTSETEFAGIPLHCFMLAQVYANHAKKYCSRDYLDFHVTNSLYDLYKEFTIFKFKTIKECDRQLIKVYHWREALLILFPGNLEAVQIVQGLTINVKTEDVPWDKIFTVGILEYTPDKPNFVHRTFAEYLLAELVVEELLTSEVVDINISFKFIINSVLFVDATTKGYLLSTNDLRGIKDFIESSEPWLTGKLNPKKLKAILTSQYDVPLEALAENLQTILSNWMYNVGRNASVEILNRAFEFLGCSQLADDLYKYVLQRRYVLKHELVCTFVEAALGKCEKMFVLKKLSRCEYNSICPILDWNQLKWKLLVCTENEYQFLTKTLIEFYRETSILNVLVVDYKLCNKLLAYALATTNVEFFKYIFDTLKSFLNLDLTDFLKIWKLEGAKMFSSPLCVSIVRGNYKLVEYLINYIGDDVKEVNDLWLACFTGSWKDSPNVIINKEKILNLLKTLFQIPQIGTILINIRSGVNVTLLITLFNLCDYIPSENDVPLMNQSVIFGSKYGAKMDDLVNWLLSKNLSHILTPKSESSRGLLINAVLGNVVKAETLSMIYKKHRFDLGTMFHSAVLCRRSESIVKTIVELSGDVNVVDINKNTLLHCAAYFRKLSVISLLLSMGANVNYRNGVGSTPLHLVFQNLRSMERSHLIHDIVSLLLSNEVDVRAKNKVGLSALDIAKPHQVELSIEDKTIELLENSVSYITALEYLSLEALKCSTDEIKNINAQECYKAYFCDCFFAWVWNILQTSGNASLSNIANTPLLHCAALFGDLTTIRFLSSKGADASSKDNSGNTPLHWIFDWNVRNNIKGLNRLNKNTNWIHDCVHSLLKCNADVSVKNNIGETPLDWALQQKDKLNIEDRTIDLLVKRFQDENEVD